ncbi:extracellular solute-binding protein [Caldibacillus lycopersici]|uniref:Extracellular solute-binding protein n=1 Tax=Perspicuibacillus lycopersici TaxID=1325689 RepID=A0AAE3IQQ9_9BACI|nr:extracellular solute-binding protein [Perspicuibacillus lycopersici]MCU9612682.1 extracellular solute-binding protein [Perspicuibacillus lycopersici]
MKKLVSLLIAFSFIFVMAACSGNSDEAGKKDGDTSKKEEQVTIKYANWNLGTEEENNIERQMIAAFEEAYPNIHVEIDQSIDSADWNGSLSAAASAGKMPDVFAMSSLPLALSNDWVMDITSIAEADEEFAKVSETVQQSIKFNDKLVAVPFAQHMLGYYVNKDLFNEANLDYPEYGASVEEFEAAIKGITDINAGVVGLMDANNIPDWYPAAVNPDMGWFTYKDGSYSLNSTEFISAMNFAKELETNSYTYNSLTEDQKANFNAQDAGQVWLNGGIAIRWDGTWANASYATEATFDFDFLGLPGGRTAITNDLLGISATTEHPEEVYTFAKWMSFGKDGFFKRLEIADEMGIPVNSLPISTDQEVVDEYFSRLDIPGVRKAYDNIDTAILEPFKTVPGYTESRFDGTTGVKVGEFENATAGQLITSFITGDLKVEDYAAQLEELANAKHDEVLESMQ